MRDDNDFLQMSREAYSAAVGTRRGRRNTALIGIGAALAAAALIVQQRSRKAERDNPPLGRFIEVEGIRLHYIERGEGQPLVLLHGDGSMIQDFLASGLVDRAAERYRVIVFDRPGYGYSERPRTTLWTPQAQAELLHHALHLLGVRQAVVLGHSWGTLVAISMALAYPGFVKSLVLIGGYYYPTARLDVPLFSSPAIPVIGDLMRYTISPLLTRLAWPGLMRRVFGPAPESQRFHAEFPVWMALRPSQLRASAADTALLIPSAFSLRDRYRELAMPVAIMAGPEDRYVKTRIHSERLHGELQHSTLHLTSGAGHMLHHLVPDEVLRVIDDVASGSGMQRVGAARHVTPPAVNRMH
jgi:pimeloyl-ACP methyl ester carboxylesterase